MAEAPAITTKSITIPAGQCGVLPNNAVIKSILVNGTATATSSCGSLPAPTAYVCGAFFFWIDNDDNTGHSMDETSTDYTSIKIGDTTYTMNKEVATGDGPGVATPVADLNVYITDPALFQFTSLTQNNSTKKSSIELFFKVPEDLFDTVQLIIDNGGSAMSPIPYEADCPEV